MATLIVEDVPAEVMAELTRAAADHRVSVGKEAVRWLALSLKRNPPKLDPPTVSDEAPPPGDIPLPGPSRVVPPLSPGYFAPDAPILGEDAR